MAALIGKGARLAAERCACKMGPAHIVLAVRNPPSSTLWSHGIWKHSSPGARNMSGRFPASLNTNFDLIWNVVFWNGVFFDFGASPAAGTASSPSHARIVAFVPRVADAEWRIPLHTWWTA